MTGDRTSDQTLVEQCIQWTVNRIHGQVFRPDMRVPSVRALARERKVSPYTVVEAYERLVAAGYLEARRGSGFYVRRREAGRRSPHRPDPRIDLRWLLRHMLESNTAKGPGVGVLPASWLDGAQVGATMRSLGRQRNGRWLENSTPHGFEPLRFVLQQRLARFDIVASAEQIILTTGITHALDLVMRKFVSPGATVLTIDPYWFGAYGVLASRGANVVGVPCTPCGPDLDAMERLIAEERPQLLVLSTAAANPTGLSLSPDVVSRILGIAARFELLVFEDDAYADLCESKATRLAAADGLNRVIYAGSFSKTLASNLRVGFMACRPELADALTDAKILSGFTTPELNERLVYELLVKSGYDSHATRLRERLAMCRSKVKQVLSRAGIEIFGDPHDGMFLWMDMRVDTNELAVAWRERGLLLAPGSLFSPHQTPGTWMRFNVTAPMNDAVTALLKSAKPDRASRAGATP